MSLDLDPRQRALLQEMGLRVWRSDLAAPAPVDADTVRSGVRTLLPPTAAAIENSAFKAISTSAAAQKAGEIAIAGQDTVAPVTLVAGIAAMDWPTLAHTVAQCQACQLCSGRRAPVFDAARAPGPADWLLVGEPPDDAEERAGTPFAAQAGQLLDNMLKALGLSRQGGPGSRATTAYVTNVVKCRPGVLRIPEPQELAVCENYLRREVALVQPKVILALGRFAAQTLLQGSPPEGANLPLGKLRGQVYRYQGIPVVVSYHPDYLLRTQQDKARAWADWCLALDVLQRGE